MTTANDEPSKEPVEIPFVALLVLVTAVDFAVESFDPPLWLGAISVGVLVGVGYRILYEIIRRRRQRD